MLGHCRHCSSELGQGALQRRVFRRQLLDQRLLFLQEHFLVLIALPQTCADHLQKIGRHGGMLGDQGIERVTGHSQQTGSGQR